MPLTVLGGQPPYQTWLIQDAATGKILVQKAIQKDSIPVYRKLQQLESPHLARIISCEEQQDIGMVTEEYISGETLDEKLHRQGVMPAGACKILYPAVTGSIGADSCTGNRTP